MSTNVVKSRRCSDHTKVLPSRARPRDALPRRHRRKRDIKRVGAAGFRGNRRSLDDVRAMADAGKAYALVGGTGVVFGAWVIQRVQETGSVFIAEGVARRVDFTLELARVDDHLADPAGGAGAGGNPQADEEDFWEWWL